MSAVLTGRIKEMNHMHSISFIKYTWGINNQALTSLHFAGIPTQEEQESSSEPDLTEMKERVLGEF